MNRFCSIIREPIIAFMIATLLFNLPVWGGQAPMVTNVRVEDDQRGHLVVFYDLKGEVGKAYAVDVAFSKDGKTYDVLPKTVTGDVGKGITSGAHRKIVWDVKADLPQGLPDGNYVCSVGAQQPGKLWPWLVGGGALVAGGAVVMLQPKEETKTTTGTIIIETPDHP